MMPPTYFFNYRELLSETRVRIGEYSTPSSLRVVHELKASEEYSLPYTLLSSYACYFFFPETNGGQFDPYHWVGINKPLTGLHVVQTSAHEVQVASCVEFDQGLLTLVRDCLGLWRERFDMSFNLPLLEEYPGVRVPRFRKSMADVLIAVLCSGHTTVTNGRRWFVFLQSVYPGYSSLKEIDPYEVMRRSKEETGASMGYRARYVINAISDLTHERSAETELERIVENNDRNEVRRKLLSIGSIGPKTVDCFLLNALGDTSSPPVDVNVQRVCSRLNLLGPQVALPQSRLCKTFLCSSGSDGCPRFRETQELLKREIPNSGCCLRAALRQKWVDAGWVQSMLFLHGIEYCRASTPVCHECKMKENCHGPEIENIPVVRIRHKPVMRSVGIMSPSFPDTVQLYPERIEHVRQRIADLSPLLQDVSGIPRNLIRGIVLWIAARKEGIPIGFKEVENFVGLRPGVLFKRTQDFLSTLSVDVPRPNLVQHVEAYGRRFHLTEEEKMLALSFSEKAFRSGLSMTPLVGVSIQKSLEISGRPLRTMELVRATGVTSVTIRKYQRILDSAL